MLNSSLYTMLKLSKTSSLQKLFDYDCVTLYIKIYLGFWEIDHLLLKITVGVDLDKGVENTG